MRVTFYGAAGQVTGSMHLVEAAGARILLDAGLFQGRRAEARQLNFDLPIDPRRLDAIILSHAHIDHSGRLPLLVRHGFHSPIYATPATRDLCGVMLADAAHIQEKDAEFLQRRGTAGPASEPLYSLPDAVAVQDLMLGVPYGRVQYIRKHLAFEFTDAGHILQGTALARRLATATMPADGEAMRLVAHRGDQVQGRRRRPGVQGAAAIGQYKGFLAGTPARPLGDADDSDTFHVEFAQNIHRLGHLPGTAVDQQDVRSCAAFGHLAEATGQRLVHRRVVVSWRDARNIETSIVRFLRSFGAEHNA